MKSTLPKLYTERIIFLVTKEQKRRLRNALKTHKISAGEVLRSCLDFWLDAPSIKLETKEMNK